MEVRHIGKRFAFVTSVCLTLLASINTFHASTLIHENTIRWNFPTGINGAEYQPLCSRETIREGSWVPTTLKAIPYIPRNPHLRCPVENFDYDNPVGPWKTWEWKPFNSSCQFASWNADLFCKLLAFSTVTIMGDSLSWEHYSSLVQLLGARVHQTDQFRSRYEDRNHVQLTCMKSGELRGTKIVWRNVADLNASVVADSIRADFPTVLILNTGAHYRNDTVLVNGLYEMLPVLKKWEADCTRRQLKCNLFWRTSVPGHPDCVNFTEPVNDFQRMEAFVRSPNSYNNKTWKYRWMWYDFQRQNQLVLNELEKFDEQYGLEYQVMDAYYVNLLRPDSHRWHQDDCLHSCYPGKMDIYSRMLLHLLQMKRTIQDAEALSERFRRIFRNSSMLNATLDG